MKRIFFSNNQLVRGMVWTGGAVLLLVGIVGLMAGLAAMGVGGGTSSSTGSAPDSDPAATATTSTDTGYSGLGSVQSAFDGNHTEGSGSPMLGRVFFIVDATDAAGRVTAYHVEINADPPFEDRERLGLVAGINLPGDATETSLNTDTCIVWQSPTLKQLIGMEYAADTTTTGSTTAQLVAEVTPHC